MKHFPLTFLLSAISSAFLLMSFRAPGDDISSLRAYQVLTKQGSYYPAAQEVHIGFTLAKAADVSVEVGRHHADAAYWPYGVWSDIYLAEPFHVQTIKLGHLEAGPHEAVWNGLDDKGQVVTETNLMSGDGIRDLVNNKKVEHPTDDQMMTHPPVNLFRFTVKAEDKEAAVNFRRAPEGVGSYRESTIGYITWLVSDGKGGFIACNGGSWQSARLTSTFQPIGYYPSLVEDNLQNVGGEDTFVGNDGHNHVLIGNTHSLFRYNFDDGKNADWPQAPQKNRMRLGAGGGTPQPEDTVKNTPGLAYFYAGWAVDSQGNSCGLRMNARLEDHPHWQDGKTVLGDIQIFDGNGAFVRTLPLPVEAYLGKPGQENLPAQIAVDKNGDFWVGSNFVYLVDGKTGALKGGQFKHPTKKVVVGGDGSVFGWGSANNPQMTDIYRLHADGTPYPFGATAPGRKDDGESMSLGGDDSPLPPSMRGSQVVAIMATDKGDFYLVMPTVGPSQPILHFSADGTYLPETLPRVEVAPQRPANAFVEDEPAVLDFYINNPSAQDRKVVLDWTLTDFFGTKTNGKSEIDVKAMSRQSAGITVPANEFGFYYFNGSVEDEGITFKTTISRVRFHDAKPVPDSHFGTVWDNNFYYGSMIGLKKERIGSYMWSWREPVKGLTIPDVADSPQGGFTARRNFAARWGVLEAEMSNYGESYTSGDYVTQIHDLSLYLTDWMGEVDKINGHNIQHYQFWNELNNFWHVPGPFSLEYYNTVNGDFWDVNKARDKETQSIPDGNVGDFNIMSGMGADGTYIYNDAVECHYPMPNADQQPKLNPSLGVSEMGKMGSPEYGPMELKKLVAIRDQYFPGKPVLDTEEGWYGDRSISDKAGADCVPRLYIPDIAVGADEIYWCAMESSPGGAATDMPLDSSLCPEVTTQPSFCSFATMTQMLEGAEYIGAVDLQKEATQAYLFRKGDSVILTTWAMVGQTDITVPIGADRVTVFDIMSRKSEIKGSSGSIPLHLTDSILYVTFPFNDWAKSIAKQELARQLTDLKVDKVESLSKEIETSAPLAATDLSAMNRYYHLVKAARQAAFAGEWTNTTSKADGVKSLRTAILAKEGADGYLRQARLPLNWTEQLVRVAGVQEGELERALLSVANETAQSAQALLAVDKVVYPGVAINPFIGDIGEIEKIRRAPFAGPDYPFYESQFRTQIPKKAGEIFELELTTWNFYRHPVEATMAPKLPEGWSAVAIHPIDKFSLASGKFIRATYTVTIPAGTKPGVYPIDGETTFNGKVQPGIRPQRVEVQ